MAAEQKRLTIQQAADELGVPRRRIWDLISRGELTAETNPLDRRSKLIEASELAHLRRGIPAPRHGATASQAVPTSPDDDLAVPEGGEPSDCLPRPLPRILGSYDGPLEVQSRDVKEYLRRHWHPE
jgi:hypothetical protein